MTALDQRPAAAPAATDADLATFRAASREYVALHRHDKPAGQVAADAQRAGITAVLADHARHPTSTVQAGLQATDQLEDCTNLQRSGWLLVGLGTHRLSGNVLYVLERAEQGSGS